MMVRRSVLCGCHGLLALVFQSFAVIAGDAASDVAAHTFDTAKSSASVRLVALFGRLVLCALEAAFGEESRLVPFRGGLNEGIGPISSFGNKNS